MSNTITTDYLILGAGIMGLALAKEIRRVDPSAGVCVLEKEPVPAWHASGRNSGVLHAGFYYTSDSLKARFTREGNRLWREYCREKNLPMNPCGKVVVARNSEETEGIRELKRRGDKNGVEVSIVDARELAEIEPNAKTEEIALWSPTTTTVDPGAVVRSLEKDLAGSGVRFFYGTAYKKNLGRRRILAGDTLFSYGTFINAAGLHADRIARDFGFGKDLTILPFKGIYLEYAGSSPEDRPVRTNIYPVPDLKQPFLGVHFTIKVDKTVKIGPTAIPAFWRENYVGLSRFDVRDLKEILGWESSLFLGNDFGFRDLALSEIRKYSREHMAHQAKGLVKKLNTSGFSRWGKPGIRAQLLDTKTRSLVSDFRVEGDRESIHILNAVSPAFTASLPFARWTIESFRNGSGWAG
ncbi:MAG: L-2-hydroxyglutarate oxidase [Leptospirales bacterium]